MTRAALLLVVVGMGLLLIMPIVARADTIVYEDDFTTLDGDWSFLKSGAQADPTIVGGEIECKATGTTTALRPDSLTDSDQQISPFYNTNTDRHWLLVARHAGGTFNGDHYYAGVFDGYNSWVIGKVIGGSDSSLASMSDDPGERVHMRFRVLGNDLKLKWWPIGEAEPVSWQIETTDSDLSGSGQSGFKCFSIALTFDDYRLSTATEEPAPAPAQRRHVFINSI